MNQYQDQDQHLQVNDVGFFAAIKPVCSNQLRSIDLENKQPTKQTTVSKSRKRPHPEEE